MPPLPDVQSRFVVRAELNSLCQPGGTSTSKFKAELIFSSRQPACCSMPVARKTNEEEDDDAVVCSAFTEVKCPEAH